MEKLRPGQLVRSKAGRDKGKHYLVLEVIGSTRVLLVDGRVRSLNRPKGKNVAHLQPYNRRIDFSSELASGKLTDGQIIRYLSELVSQEALVQQKED